MMIKIMKKAIVLGLTALVLFTGMPAMSVKAMNNAPLHSSVSISGIGNYQKVTYKLTLDKTDVTDGRVAVVYDPEVLTLTSGTTGIKFADNDFNKNYSESEEAGVSYAFVNDSAKRVSGSLLTLTFSVKKNIEYQDTVVKTEVFGINNEDKEVVSEVALTDSVSVGRPKPQKPANLRATQTLLGVALTWNIDANADAYRIYRSTSEKSGYTEIGVISVPLFYDLKVKNGTTYYYKVEAYQKSGSNTISSEKSNPAKIKVKKLLGIFG